jgi:UDP-N-acetylmuramate--alanine ligase
MLADGAHVHLVGIGGAGLSAIARVLLGLGYTVSGSDQTGTELTEALVTEGAAVTIGHAANNIDGADLLLVSSAIPAENPEVAAARGAGVPVLKRADLAGELMAGRTGVAVAGTHGKTTTTAMVVSVLLAAGLDPSFIVGGVLAELGTNAAAGRGDIFVVEADEYDHMFLGLRPQTAVLTVVEHDHPDCYPTAEAVMDAFRAFVNLLPADGTLVACCDDPGARTLGKERERSGGSVCWYGFASEAHWRASHIQANQAGGNDFVVLRGGETEGLARLRLPGQHNVLNALAAIAVADLLEVPFNVTRTALSAFGGVERRFEVKGEEGGVTVVDDYAHHPTEIAATLAAARGRYGDRRVWAVFQPHTYSRTRALMSGFLSSFGDADKVVVLDIYAAREADTLGVSAQELAAQMEHPNARYVGELCEAAAYLVDRLQPGDVLVTLGAGDGNMVGEWVIDALRNRRGPGEGRAGR